MTLSDFCCSGNSTRRRLPRKVKNYEGTHENFYILGHLKIDGKRECILAVFICARVWVRWMRWVKGETGGGAGYVTPSQYLHVWLLRDPPPTITVPSYKWCGTVTLHVFNRAQDQSCTSKTESHILLCGFMGRAWTKTFSRCGLSLLK